jgi:hypothetical protein
MTTAPELTPRRIRDLSQRRNDATVGRGTVTQREESKVLNLFSLRSLRRGERSLVHRGVNASDQGRLDLLQKLQALGSWRELLFRQPIRVV